jgi:hypothetical protein
MIKLLVALSIGFIGFVAVQPAPKKTCPIKDGIIRPVESWESISGTMKGTVQIIGIDSLVRSATDGRVRDIDGGVELFSRSVGSRIAIYHDTATYSYSGIDSCLVKEGQVVKAGQVIGFAKKHKVYFFVSNWLYTHISTTPQNYVDCVCELPK